MTAVARNNADQSRYELDVNGQIVFADYQRTSNVVTILHVEAPVSLHGTGAAGKFMQAMMEKIREEGLKAMPVCGYAVAWLGRHGEYNDLIVHR